MARLIRKVAVLGAGTMGARIAAHLANAGVPSLLLDMVPPDANGSARNRIAAAGLEAARKSKPAAFFEPSLARLVRIGNFDDDLKLISDCDWVIEAVIENLEAKRELLRRVEKVRRPGNIVTTNTSGLPVHRIAEGFSDDFRRNWLGTHFFNPPRYMRLLELIPTSETYGTAVDAIARFCDVHLGKGVVIAHDTPNFIANRIGTFSVMNVMRVMQEMDLSIEEVDALTGSALGWPRSATFRTIDMVGLDILGHVARNTAESVRDERTGLALPNFFQQMLERKWLGDKTGAGFYKKVLAARAESQSSSADERLALDWKTLEYRPRQKPKFAALEMAKNIESTPERLRMLLGLDGNAANAKSKEGKFLWNILSDVWSYSANRIGEVADSLADIDRAMRLGFNWELGPFELWDAAGVRATVERMKEEGQQVAGNAEKLLGTGKSAWYQDQASCAGAAQSARDAASSTGRSYFDVAAGDYKCEQVPAGQWSVTAAKKGNNEVKRNSGASLVDLGDGVGCIEFHAKMNALGPDIIQLVISSLKPGGASPGLGDNFDAFVITNDAQNFSAGANLMLLLM